MNDQDKIQQLLQKIAALSRQQEAFGLELQRLKKELLSLQKTTSTPSEIVAKDQNSLQNATEKQPKKPQEEVTAPPELTPESSAEIPVKPIPKKPKRKSDLEKFIGENLINKIGIAITVIGVVIGAKYSIENDLISPLTRIILGYFTGIGLLGFGMKLKKKYKNYSAVLVSGAIAILYIVTFLGYSFYDLFPQVVAFGLMVVFTVFTVITALHYNKQIIAHIGLVGAYAVPFLLSTGSGQVAVLFSYVALINIGILIIAFKRYWKPLYYVAFVFTYAIYLVWFASKYEISDFGLALSFLSVFFVSFYIMFIAYKILQKEQFNAGDVILLLLNSFIFYGLGYAILDQHEIGTQLLGVFTLGNAVLHFIVSVLFYRQKLADRNVFYLAVGMVLTFVTITIPVQLDGNWVSLLWTAEAALLFWIGSTKKIRVYENMSYVLMLLAICSLFHDWSYINANYYYTKEDVAEAPTAFFNIYFAVTLVSVGLFGWITKLNAQRDPNTRPQGFFSFFSHLIPWMFIVTLYFCFRMEIVEYWNQQYGASYLSVFEEGATSETVRHNWSLNDLKIIWVLNYSVVFIALLNYLNIKKFQHRLFGVITLGISAVAVVVFLTQGLYILSELREAYLTQLQATYYHMGWFHIGIRYVALCCFAFLVWSIYRYMQQSFVIPTARKIVAIALHSVCIWLASSELIHWMDMFDFSSSYKLGLSMLWGIYALGMVGYGIWKDKKYIRITAIVWFGITLLKLFLYDMASMSTIAKTVVFVSLGILLLIISFLYTKYKHLISKDKNQDHPEASEEMTTDKQ